MKIWPERGASDCALVAVQWGEAIRTVAPAKLPRDWVMNASDLRTMRCKMWKHDCED